MQQAAYSKKSTFFILFFQCLGSLCTFYFIDKIVYVQYIVQIYAEKHTGARCESLNKRRSCQSYCVMTSLMLSYNKQLYL